MKIVACLLRRKIVALSLACRRVKILLPFSHLRSSLIYSTELDRHVSRWHSFRFFFFEILLQKVEFSLFITRSLFFWWLKFEIEFGSCNNKVRSKLERVISILIVSPVFRSSR